MKQQIRIGVFETNSSSTHSMQLVDTTNQDPLEIIKDIIMQKYGDQCRNPDYYTPDIRDNVLYLHSVELSESDENTVAICVFQSLFAKIEYLFMDLLSYKYNFNTYNETFNKYSSEFDIKTMVETSTTYKYFSDAVLDFLKKKHKNASIDKISLEDYQYFEGTYGDVPIFTQDEITDKKKIREKVFKILNDKYAIMDKDIAYYPYQTPIIKVI